MRFIGDIHAKWQGYVMAAKGCDETYQVGDFGLGYPDTMQLPIAVQQLRKEGGAHYWIRGNHDNPRTAEKDKWCLGDVGYHALHGMMWVAGASTPSWAMQDFIGEQLSYSQLEEAIETFKVVKPRIMISHDCPEDIKKSLMIPDRHSETSATNLALQTMFEAWQPDLWVFGHYHRRVDERVWGTRFVCLEEFGVLDYEA